MNNSLKSEKEKMIDEELYYSVDQELLKLRKECRIKLREYNFTTEDEQEERHNILKNLFGKVDGIIIEPPFYCDYGFNIFAGKNFYMNFDCVILDCAKVEIGDNVLCGPKVQIYTATHRVEPESRLKGEEYAKSIRIGNNVWLGGGCIICPGVTIGDNSVIGAGSVVTKDIPDNVVAVGNPCRIVKHLNNKRD